MRRGFSLAELLVGASLALVLSVLLFQALVAAIRLTSRSSERSKAQLEATVVWNRLLRDLQASEFSQLLIVDLPTPPGQGLLLPMLEGITASGAREWSKNRVLLHWDRPSKELRRRLVVQPVVDPAAPLAGLLALIQAPAGPTERVLSNCLKSFQAALTPARLVRLDMTFEVAPGRELKLAGSIGARN